MTPWPTGVPKGPKVREYEAIRDVFVDGGNTGFLVVARPDFPLKADDMLAECAETIERLCVCGNCRSCEFDEVYYCGSGGEGATMPWHWHTKPSDRCHFTPSRWTPYWDAEQKAAEEDQP